MVEPVTIVLAIYQIVNLLSAGVQLFRNFFGNKPSVPTESTPVPSRLIAQNTARIEHESSKRKEKSGKDFQSTRRTSSEESYSMLVLILLIGIVLLFVVYFLHRLRREMHETNRFNRRRTESPSSPSTPDRTKQSSLTVV